MSYALRKRINELYDSGLTMQRVASQVNRSFSRVQQIVATARSNQISSLTCADVLTVNGLYDTGMSLTEVAEQMGYSYTTVWRLVTFKRSRGTRYGEERNG